jgi:hypothetical protein
LLDKYGRSSGDAPVARAMPASIKDMRGEGGKKIPTYWTLFLRWHHPRVGFAKIGMAS